MRTTSAVWDELSASNAGILETKAVINGTEYTLTSVPVITRSAMQDAMTVGNVISASCVLTISTTDTIPKAAEVVISSRYTDGETSSEWLPMGTFYISKRKRDPLNGLIALECYDGLLKANAPYQDATAVVYPRAMADVADDIADTLGLEIDARSTIATGAIYTIAEPAQGTPMRDVLIQIAAANAGNWIVTPENELRLLPVVSADGADGALSDVVEVTAIIGGLQVSDERTVSGIQYTYGENAMPVLIGDDTGYIMNVSLPSALANVLYETVVGMVYRPYTMTNCRYNPAAEIGDYIRYGDIITSVLYTETVSYGVIMGSSIQAPDFAEVLDEYPYVGASQSALNQAKAYTVQQVDALDESLTQQDVFNRLTGGGSEQGVILYNGKIYINASYINAGELSANRISGGTLTLGGVNNQSGTLRVLDASGNETSGLSNEGFYFKSSNSRYGLYISPGGSISIGGKPDNLDMPDSKASIQLLRGGTTRLVNLEIVSNPEGRCAKLIPVVGGGIWIDGANDDDNIASITPNMARFYSTTLRADGGLEVVGNVRFFTPLTVGNGGTGADNAADARTNLGAQQDMGFYIDQQGYICQRIGSDA